LFREISNFAVLKYEDYCLLKDGFKEWAEELERIDELLKIEILSNLDYFIQKKEIPTGNIEHKLNKVSDDLITVKYIFLHPEKKNFNSLVL